MSGLTILALPLLTVLIGAQPAAPVQSSATELRFSGPLTAATVQQIESGLTGGRRSLRITSSGGDARAALDLGEFIQAHKISVVADRYCFSACASYVLPASPNPRLLPGALLGFHDTMTSLYEAARSQDPAVAEQTYGAFARRERALYGRLGIDQALLVLPADRLDPVCAFISRSASTDVPTVVVASRYTVYAPSGQLLARLGMHIGGDVPSTPDAVRVAFQKNLPASVSMKVRLDQPGDGPTDADHTRARIERLTTCPAAIQERARRDLPMPSVPSA